MSSRTLGTHLHSLQLCTCRSMQEQGWQGRSYWRKLVVVLEWVVVVLVVVVVAGAAPRRPGGGGVGAEDRFQIGVRQRRGRLRQRERVALDRPGAVCTTEQMVHQPK